MFFNEDTPITEVLTEPKEQEVATHDIDEISPLECGGQPCPECEKEDVDLDFDEISPLNQTTPDDNERSDEYQDELINTEDVDLDFDEISPLNQTTQKDSERTEPQDELINIEDVDLDFDEISPLNQTTPDDNERSDEYQDLETIKPISLGESSVKIFPRSSRNIILESDFNAVCNYYNNSLSEEVILSIIAEAHNISKDSLFVLVENQPVNVKNKLAPKKSNNKKTGIDKMIEALRQKKAKMTPEQWKSSGNADKLKRLLAQRTLKTTN